MLLMFCDFVVMLSWLQLCSHIVNGDNWGAGRRKLLTEKDRWGIKLRIASKDTCLSFFFFFFFKYTCSKVVLKVALMRSRKLLPPLSSRHKLSSWLLTFYTLWLGVIFLLNRNIIKMMIKVFYVMNPIRRAILSYARLSPLSYSKLSLVSVITVLLKYLVPLAEMGAN